MVKALFFGTPNVAVPYLNWLIDHTTVVGAVCRPDEKVGRGYKIMPPPIKVLAEQKHIPVFQPEGPWTEDIIQKFQALGADLGIIVAYGRILPRSIFSIPKHGCVNIHFSLLPKYRGAAPMQWALINGETTTGVTSFWLEEGLDSGPIADQSSIPVHPTDDIVSLREKLIALGLTSLETVIKDVSAGKMVREPQNGQETLAPQLKKETGQIRWDAPAASIVNLIRGVREWPGAATSYASKDGPKLLKIFSAEVADPKAAKDPGKILEAAKTGFVVGTSQGTVRVKRVQPEGKKEMPSWDFWQGAHLSIGDKLG